MIEEKFTKFAQPEEIVLLVTELGGHPADPAGWFPDLSGLEVPAAPLIALVPPGRSPAVRADPLNIPVRKRSLASHTVTLLDHLRIDVPVLYKALYDVTGPPVIGWIICHPEVIKRDTHSLECLVEVIVIPFGKSPGRDSCLLGTYHDRSSMVVRTTDENYGLPRPPKVADIEIGRDIGPEVTQVTGAIGVGKAAGHEERSVAHHYLF
jgi:hypothetical protein